MNSSQLTLGFPSELSPAAYDYGLRSSGESHGVVLTKPHIVELMLDLAGYTEDRDLAALTFLEPSCGHGAFLGPALSRLVRSARSRKRPLSDLNQAIAAYDISVDHVVHSRGLAATILADEGFRPDEAMYIAERWIQCGDFLLAPIQQEFDVVVGNPPYVRVENLASELQAEYRARFATLFDRADLYIAFIERSLTLLKPEGILSFICADRWVRNKYGAPLRSLISRNYAMRWYVDIHKTSPFESEVSAYPSIFGVSKSVQKRAVPVVTLPTASPEECAIALGMMRGESLQASGVTLTRHADSFSNSGPWILSNSAERDLLKAMEEKFAPLESLPGTRVGIGVATGNDSIYIVDRNAPIESDRLVPLVMRGDISRGATTDSGRCVINTFCEGGGLIDLAEYPLLSRYFDAHTSAIQKRHVAKRNPSGWFRTIDRVYPELVPRPKLLIPDIARTNEVTYDAGLFHPHHNLYFVTSEEWDMEILGALLSSRMALFFVWSYATKMRGGYIRFQAQYLRRIRIPHPGAISPKLATQLKAAFRERDFASLDALALNAYAVSRLPEFDLPEARY
ncbi:Eco57I restriction-modification methylase domain-containing protein [soil metagenome]